MMSNAILELGTEVAMGEIERLNDSLANVRDRALRLLSAATIAGSLAASLGLVGQAASVDSTSSVGSTTPRWLVAVLLVPSVLIALTALYTLQPAAKWNYGRNPLQFIKIYESERSEEECRKQLITQLSAAISQNEVHVRKRTVALRVAVALLVTQLALILLAVILVQSYRG